MMERASRVAEEGSSVLLDINDGDKLVFARLNSSATVKVGNLKCSLSSIVGSPYGTLFQIEGSPQESQLVRSTSSEADLTGNTEEINGDETTMRDNRSLIDNNKAQKLSADEIKLMRSEGVSGDKIVETIIANSSTFQNKTAFSQEKYKRKKQKKYLPRVLLRRPSARSICEAYFIKTPAKIGFLRMDTLSLILSLANIGAHSDALVVDMISGIIIGAVAERLGGFGSVCNAYKSTKLPPTDIVGLFNFSETTRSRIYNATISELLSAHLQHFEIASTKKDSNLETVHNVLHGDIDTPLEEGSTLCQTETKSNIVPAECIGNYTEIDPKSKFQDSCTMKIGKPSEATLHPNFSNDKKIEHETRSDIVSEVRKPSKAIRQADAGNIAHWTENGFSSLIVAAPENDPWNVIEELLPLVAPSGPFVVYHQYIQPLAECMNRLQMKRMAVALQIFEPWLREYQVLPSRTHPHMQMSSFGGYILTGIRIANDASKSNV